MEFRLNDRMEKGLAVIFFIVLGIISFTAASAQDRVIITGRIISSTTSDGPAARLIAGDGEVMNMTIQPNGRFWVNAPAADRYSIEFSQPGCLDKMVVIDPRHAPQLNSSVRERQIEFDVVLHADERTGSVRYSGPVGNISFDPRNGRMLVTHRYEMVALGAAEDRLALGDR